MSIYSYHKDIGDETIEEICRIALNGIDGTPLCLMSDDEFVNALSYMRVRCPHLHLKVLECIDPLHPLEKMNGPDFDWMQFLMKMTKKQLKFFARTSNIAHAVNSKQNKDGIAKSIASFFERDPASLLLVSTVHRIKHDADMYRQCQQDPETRIKYQELVDGRHHVLVEKAAEGHDIQNIVKLDSLLDETYTICGLCPSFKLHRQWLTQNISYGTSMCV